jgi:ABC-2 type transport system permease protein
MMARQIRSEWIKAMSLRSTWVIIGLSILGIIAQAVTALIQGGSTPAAETRGVMSGSSYTLVLMVIIGAVASAGEYSRKSIITTYTTSSNRARPILAKTLVVIAIALVIGALSVPLSRLVAAIWYAAGSGTWDAGIGTAIHYAYGTMITYVGFAVLGVMIGLLCRSTAIAVGVAFGVLFIIDPILAAVTTYSEYTATATASTMLDPDTHQTAQPEFGAAIALMVLYMVVLTGIALGVERRRDVA